MCRSKKLWLTSDQIGCPSALEPNLVSVQMSAKAKLLLCAVRLESYSSTVCHCENGVPAEETLTELVGHSKPTWHAMPLCCGCFYHLALEW